MIAKCRIGEAAADTVVRDDIFVQTSLPVDAERQDTRIDYLLKMVRGRRVLHIGCCDHIDLIDRKIASGDWLHELLLKNAEVCWGVDINRNAVDHVLDLGYKNIYCCDIEQDVPDALREARFDVMILGEMVEHLDSPVSFLRALHRCFDYEYELIATVPNAYFLENFENAINHFERVNSDHRVLYTPYTIAKVLSLAGYRVDDVVYLYRGIPSGYWQRDERLKTLYGKCPELRDVIAARASSGGPCASGLAQGNRCDDLSVDEMDSLIRSTDGTVDDISCRASVANEIVTLATLPFDPYYDAKISSLIRDMRYWHDKYIAERNAIVARHEEEVMRYKAEIEKLQADLKGMSSREMHDRRTLGSWFDRLVRMVMGRLAK